tara:strand:+ start:293 stop:469 length:177 start_codon:yes stop_codon:yes gene_type:complete
MAKTTKVVVHTKPSDDASTVDGSLAKAISDAIGANSVASISSSWDTNTGAVIVVITTT